MFNPLNFISKFVKSGNQKELDRIGKIVRQINLFEENMSPCGHAKYTGGVVEENNRPCGHAKDTEYTS